MERGYRMDMNEDKKHLIFEKVDETFKGLAKDISEYTSLLKKLFVCVTEA